MGNTEASPSYPAPCNSVSFTLNGHPVTVSEFSPTVTLNQWLRAQPGLTGTKRMCGEGGCGACVVTAAVPGSGQESVMAINSCLCPLYSIQGWTITTVEGIGSSKAGFHPIQTAIAEHNGSQCGYCTPGFVMSMYSLLQSNPKPTEREVEDIFDGNICRCTGYRPILDAMKTFASDHTPKTGQSPPIIDIEDLSPRVCLDSEDMCVGLWRGLKRTNSDPQWYRPSSLSQLMSIAKGNQEKSARLVAGDTGRGVFKNPPNVEVVIYLKGIPELSEIKTTPNALIVGGCVTLTRLIQSLSDKPFPSFKVLSQHLLKVANVPVRNVGTWAGNLMMVHEHRDFPSDVFTILAGLRATVTICHSTSGQSSELNLWEFLDQDMSQSILISLSIPIHSEGKHMVYQTFKIMPRAVNAHAYVNAAFLVHIEDDSVVKATPTIVYGGLSTKPVLMTSVCDYLVGKSLSDPETLKGALEKIDTDIVMQATPLPALSEYRKSLAITLFYKFIISVLPKPLPPSLQSVLDTPPRSVSRGNQVYTTKPSEYPITQPLTKITAKLQASGEAEYTSDYPHQANELAAAFVLSSMANAEIVSIDCNKAKGMPGFVRFLTFKDIPGENNFSTNRLSLLPLPEEVFAEKISQYAGQPLALILADTQEQADRIAGEVTVTYKSLGAPILTLEDAIQKESFFSAGRMVKNVGDTKTAISHANHVITGQVECGSQYPFHMETQTAIVIPKDQGFEVHSSTQWVDHVQSAVANMLGIPASSVDVSVKRVGGAYGAKSTRASLIATACALGASVTRRPVRMYMDLDTNMKALGKRFPYLAKYRVASTSEGVITAVDVEVFADCGYHPGGSSVTFVVMGHIDNAYYVPNWTITTRKCKTHTPANTIIRAPGTKPAIFIMETMIDHLATSLGKDVETVKAANLYKNGQMSLEGKEMINCNVSAIWEQLFKFAEVDRRKREISEYNKTSRWYKKGLCMMPLRFGIYWIANPYNVTVNVYAEDGTVAVAHGGVEMGQGINTKVAQVASKVLGVPMDMIRIKPIDSMLNPNGQWSGGSLTSELNCLGTINACKELNSRLDTVREQNPGLEWKDLIQKCSGAGVNLSVRAVVKETTASVTYNCFGSAVTEVGVDVLTGETRIERVDILYDCGDSINPEIDTGQLEGAFVMGLGYWLTEKIIYHKDTGQLLTHNTWEYKPPSQKDIPIDFRVELLRDAPNPIGVLGSKAVGEPPQCMSCSVLFAVKRAIESARADSGVSTHFTLDGPATVETIQQACLTTPDQLILK